MHRSDLRRRFATGPTIFFNEARVLRGRVSIVQRRKSETGAGTGQRAWIGRGSRSRYATGRDAAVAWPSACPSSACFASRVRLTRRRQRRRQRRPETRRRTLEAGPPDSRPIARARTRLRIFLCLVTGSGS